MPAIRKISVFVLTMVSLMTGPVFGRSATPPINSTGAPGHASCAQCHTSTGGDGGVGLSISGGGSYEPGQLYSITVTVEDPGQSRFGFSMVARDSDNSTQDVGTWSAGSADTQTYAAGNTHIGHLNAPVDTDSHSFTVNWTAPASGVGDVTFYVASVAANNNNSNGAGDFAYLNTLTINQISPNQVPSITVPPGPKNVTTGLPRAITGVLVADPDAGSGDLTLTLTAMNGILNIKDSVPGGVGAGNISNNNSGNVTVFGTIAELTATLSDSSGLVYQSTPGYNGSDTLSLTLNDNGNTGSGGPLQVNDSIQIEVFPFPDLSNYTFISASEFRFVLNGTPGESYRVESSDDLSQWDFLTAVTLSGPTTTIIDNSVASVSQRFYRVRIEAGP